MNDRTEPKRCLYCGDEPANSVDYPESCRWESCERLAAERVAAGECALEYAASEIEGLRELTGLVPLKRWLAVDSIARRTRERYAAARRLPQSDMRAVVEGLAASD